MFIKKALLQKDKENFHHGYLLTGDFEVSRKMALEAAKVLLNLEDCTESLVQSPRLHKLETHPDFSFQKFDLFGIDDSHELRRRASQRPLAGTHKVFVIEITSFSIESANALLKLFEEPYEGTHFFVIAPSLEDVIPTLRSRLIIIDNTDTQKTLNEEKMKFFEKFLKDLPNKRLDSIKNIIKDREEAIEFLNEIEIVLRSSTSKWKLNFQVLEQIQKCRDFLFQKGSSPKIILEHIALTLPQI